MKKKNNFKNLLDDKRVVLVASIALAILFWTIVAGFISPGEFRRIDNVSIDFSKGAETYQNLDLWVVSNPGKNSSVSVNVRGNAANIASLTNADMSAVVDYSTVTGPGEYTLNLRLNRSTAGNYTTPEWGIRSGTTYVQQVRMLFESVESKNIPLEIHADNIKAAEGYFRGTPSGSVTEIILEGPSSAVSKIAHAVARITDEDIRAETLIRENIPVILLDENGEAVDDTNITLSTSLVDVTIPILEQRSLPLTMGISGAQQGFDTEWFQSLMILDPAALQVAGSPSILNTLTGIEIGMFDISTFELKKTYPPIPISLRTGLTTQDTHTHVSLSFDTALLEERSFEISDFSVANLPVGLDIEPLGDARVTVRLVGTKEELAKILPEHITVQIEAQNISPNRAGARESLAARVVVARSDKVFAIGTYQVMCDILSAKG